MSTSPNDDLDVALARTKAQGAGYLLRALAGLSLLVVLVAAALGLWWLKSRRAHQQELAAQIQRIRDAGEPLDGAELNQWYRVPTDVHDLTPRVQELISFLYESEEVEKLDATVDLPYFGVDEETIPLPGNVWDDIQRNEAFLSRQSEILCRLIALSRQHGAARFPIDAREGVTIDFNHIDALRTLTRLCCLKAQVLCHRKEYGPATDFLIAGIRLAETLRSEPFDYSQRVRVAMHDQLSAAVCVVLSDRHLPVAEIRRLQNELSGIDRDSAAHVAWLGQRAILYETVTSAPGGAAPNEDGTLADVYPSECALLMRLASDIVAASKDSYPGMFQRQLAVAAEAELEWERSKSSWSVGDNELLGVMLNDYRGVCRQLAEGSARHRCMLAILAAERYWREAGAYPPDLEALAPTFIEGLPKDPFTGKPLRCLATNTQFIVYSVGANGEDDGGDVAPRPFHLNQDIGVSIPPYRATADDRGDL